MFVLSNKNIKVCVFLMALLLSSGKLYADDVITSIDEALQYYKEGAFTEAVESLNYASQLIQQKKGEGLESLLPKPLDGWTAQTANSQAAGAAMFGGGVTAQRQYSKGSSSITVQIITDSPLMQGVMMMFSNPMFAASDGGKLEKIKRQKAIVNYDPANQSGEIKIVVVNRYLILIEGTGVARDELKGYAQAIDYKKLKSLQ